MKSNRETKRIVALLLFAGILIPLAIALYKSMMAGNRMARLALASIGVLLIILELALRRNKER